LERFANRHSLGNRNSVNYDLEDCSSENHGLESHYILRNRDCQRRNYPRHNSQKNVAARSAASYLAAAAKNLRYPARKQNHNQRNCSDSNKSRANSSNSRLARCDSSSPHSARKCLCFRPWYARAVRNGSNRCQWTRHGSVMPAAAPRMAARVACSVDARCWAARTIVCRRGFHTGQRNSFPCLPGYYSFHFYSFHFP
jgi:hypothetical protein